MAKYSILSLEVKKIEKGPNKGNEYIIGKIRDHTYFYSTPITVTFFDTEQIASLKPFIPKSKGGLSEGNELALPEEAKYIYGGIFTYIPPKEQRPFIRVYTTTDQSRGWVAGEPILDRKTGKPQLFNDIRVFCIYNPHYKDNALDADCGAIESPFDVGKSPEDVGQAQFKAFFMAYNDYLEKKGLAPVNPGGSTTLDDIDDVPPIEPQKPTEQPTGNEKVYTDASGRKFVLQNGVPVYL